VGSGVESGDGRWEMGDGRWEMGDGRWEMGAKSATRLGTFLRQMGDNFYFLPLKPKNFFSPSLVPMAICKNW
jgi:hypothetical protein